MSTDRNLPTTATPRPESPHLRVLPSIDEPDHLPGSRGRGRPSSGRGTGNEPSAASRDTDGTGLLVSAATLDELVASVLALRANAVLTTATRASLAPATNVEPSTTSAAVHHDLFTLAPTRSDATTLLTALTGREREVFERLAQGASNAEIASQLFLSTATVKTHVARVLAKLSLRDRAHAIIFAYETGLVRPGTTPLQRHDRDPRQERNAT